MTPPLYDVIDVQVVGHHRLRLTFEDGTVGEVDLSRQEWRGVFEPLADPEYFAQVRVDAEGGTMVWPKTLLAPDGGRADPGTRAAR